MRNVDSMTIEEIKQNIFEILGEGDIDSGRDVWENGNSLDAPFLVNESLENSEKFEKLLKEEMGFEWIGIPDADTLGDGFTVRTIFKVGERYIQLTGWYSSYGDSPFDEEEWQFVKPVEKVITEWEKVGQCGNCSSCSCD